MGNLIIVSNRLPVGVKRVDGKLEFYPTVGGLATGLSSYAAKGNSKWIGWPGIPSDDLSEQDKKAIAKELKKHKCYPVHLTKKQLELYYNDYSNSVLWPLFHSMEVRHGNTTASWNAYREVNELFAEETIALSQPGSTIWVHDYQLLLLPGMLRNERPTDHIGFFLHIPFPSAAEFTPLKQASELLQGMLGADLVGLHTTSYTEGFLESCRRLGLGLVEPRKVALPDRLVRVTNFPISIDYSKFAKATKQRAVRRERRKLGWKYRGKKVVITVDRLDPTKGLPGRLEAYEKLLAKNPSLHKKVVLVVLAVPSRAEIVEYKELKERVDKLVARINKKFGTATWQPVDYHYESWPFERLAALYQRADVAFIAPVRDGMNLVAKEYIASRPKHDGVLILSETAGAAEELKDAVLVDPTQPKTLVTGLQQALTMPRGELKRRTSSMQHHLETFTVQAWADSFMNALQKPVTPKPILTKHLNAIRTQEIVFAYHQAQKRLILLDYDGVLRPFMQDPADARPSLQVLKLLKRLGSEPRNEVVIISGRSKADLQGWFGSLPVALAAEHGALFRRKGGKNWHKTAGLTSRAWRGEVLPILEYYADLTPGAFVERKEWSLVWHYRNAKPYYAQKHLVALRRLLKPVAKQYDLVIKEGNKVFELHPAIIGKGRIAQEWLIHEHDFILCAGDDVTDEDIFAVLPTEAYSIKVGRGPTGAGLRTKGVSEILHLLGRL
ncbi:bifunctional alpha,alpha-trehalose-phosphate synthase (UDP-forming)/trehalose-phosphatase [Candidatus Saccharibacteria bacterium]|nr:MAG: bifunctional alpha,alpha-trehalose-phosphate synthase (UDP-forming)/trehalose-phosphatase [Candidatus Saccharibacteria bacterium]